MSMVPTLLSVENLSKSYGGVHAVRSVSFELRAGEILALIGPNGAGKSTCFDMLNGQNTPDSGRINLLGEDTVGQKPRAIWRLGVGRTFQITATFPTMTVRENVQVALLSYGRRLFNLWRSTAAYARDEAGRLLDLVGMAAYAERPCGELAYGDLKRLELAIALANQPKLLLMDEPTAGMAPRERIELMRLTARIAREQSIGVLFTEHDMDVVFRACRPHSRPESRHVDCRGLAGRSARQSAGARHLSRRRAGLRSAPPRGSRGMKLSVQDLNSFYGPAHILFDVALEVGEGEVVALLGRNGAGKSTTFRSIVGLVQNRSGKIVFEGKDVSAEPTHAIVRSGLGYVPEERRIFTDLTVEENLEVGKQPKRPNAPYWTREKLFTLFPNLGEMRNRPGGRMSGGEQQMLTIARTLMGNPSLVLLDEPSEGLSPKIVEQMVDAILTMKKEGVSIVVSEQNLHFARLISDRAYIIERGKICFGGTMAELDARPDILDAHLSL